LTRQYIGLFFSLDLSFTPMMPISVKNTKEMDALFLSYNIFIFDFIPIKFNEAYSIG